MDIIEDKLNRSNYINFLIHLMQNCDKYKRSSENHSYSIAVNSPWGTGKTTLMQHLQKRLEEEHSEEFKVVVYNAWEHDFVDNAFEPLMFSLLNSEAFDLNKKEANIVELTMGIWNVIKAMGRDAASFVHCSNTYDAMLQYAKTQCKILNDENVQLEENCKNYFSMLASMEAFKKALSTCFMYNETDKKLVVIIDELDRCRPKFAIDTLEVVKHILNIPNIVFIFAIDVRQLSYSMTNIYGSKMDTIGYLSRLFDYVTQIPEPDLYRYVYNALGDSISEKEIENPNEITKLVSMKRAVVDYFLCLRQCMNLSLRDIDTLICNYRIIIDTALKEETHAGPYLIYLFFLAIKYKYPDIYSVLVSQVEEHIKNKVLTESVLNNSIVIKYPYISAAISAIKCNKIMSLKNHSIYLNTQRVDRDSNKQFQDFSFKNDTIKIYEIPHYIEERLIYGNSIDGILFKSDLENWEQIKFMTYGNYLSKQLENFNFISQSLDVSANNV